MREVPLAKGVAGVRAAIDGAGEVLVTPGPIRPLLALKELIPGLDGPVLRAMGVMDTLKARARTTLFGDTVGQLTPEERRALYDWLNKNRQIR